MNSNNYYPARYPALLNLDDLGGELPFEESTMVPMRRPGPARALPAAEIDWSQVELLLPVPRSSPETINVTVV